MGSSGMGWSRTERGGGPQNHPSQFDSTPYHPQFPPGSQNPHDPGYPQSEYYGYANQDPSGYGGPTHHHPAGPAWGEQQIAPNFPPHAPHANWRVGFQRGRPDRGMRGRGGSFNRGRGGRRGTHPQNAPHHYQEQFPYPGDPYQEGQYPRDEQNFDPPPKPPPNSKWEYPPPGRKPPPTIGKSSRPPEYGEGNGEIQYDESYNGGEGEQYAQ